MAWLGNDGAFKRSRKEWGHQGTTLEGNSCFFPPPCFPAMMSAALLYHTYPDIHAASPVPPEVREASNCRLKPLKPWAKGFVLLFSCLKADKQTCYSKTITTSSSQFYESGVQAMHTELFFFSSLLVNPCVFKLVLLILPGLLMPRQRCDDWHSRKVSVRNCLE